MIAVLATDAGSEGFAVFALFGAIFGAILVLIDVILLCLGTSAEKRIERELKACSREFGRGAGNVSD